MDSGINLTGYDFVVLGLFLLFVARGIWLGLLRQVTGLLSLCLAYYVASHYHDRLFPFLKDISDNPKVVFVASIALLFIATYIGGILIGKALAYVVEIALSKWFDKLLGALLGAVMASVVVVFVHMVLSSVLPPENKMIRTCQTCNELNAATDYARAFIKDEEVRKALMQQAPAITTEDLRQFFESDSTTAAAAPQQEPQSDAQQQVAEGAKEKRTGSAAIE